MKSLGFTPEERRQVNDWIQDENWIKQERYEQDTDYLECVYDILDNPVFQSMEQYIQHGTTSCKKHCIQVSYLSYRICRKRGWDYRAAARAGLLHDLFLYDWHTHAKETGHHFHGYTHPRVAMRNAAHYFTLTEMEKNSILRHMWPLTPIPPKSWEGFVIVYADKFCSSEEIVTNIRNWILDKAGVGHDVLGKAT